VIKSKARKVGERGSFWRQKAWHHKVHQHLGETLHYYLARVRPYDAPKAKKAIEEMAKLHKLGSIRVFELFGPYDLLIRVWAHPAQAEHLRDWLMFALKPSDPLCPFMVHTIHRRWYWQIDSELNPEAVRNTLVALNEKTFRELQEGNTNGQLKDIRKNLVKNNLIVARTPHKPLTIKFFVAISLKNDAAEVIEAIVADISSYLGKERVFKYASIYSGWGYFSVLVKAQVGLDHYFKIRDLATAVVEKYKAAGASRETYLVDSLVPEFEVEELGKSTFNAIHGMDLFVNGIVPELYQQDLSPEVIEEIEHLLRSEAQALRQSTAISKMIHDYVLAYLSKDETTMATTLLALFMSFERYLSVHFGEFVGRHSKKAMREVINEVVERGKSFQQKKGAEADEQTHASEKDRDYKKWGLWALLAGYSIAIETHSKSATVHLAWRWEDVAEIRNGLAHYRDNLLEDWQRPLTIALRNLPRMRELIELVQRVTNKPYTGTL
jgi:hypothetical protein